MKHKTVLRAGAAQVDITPAMGTQIAGDIGRYRPVEEIRDPLFAKALVIEHGKRRVCWLALDVLAIGRRESDAIRQEAAARFGLDEDHILVHATQTHSAPSVGHFFVFDGDVLGLFPKEQPWLLGGDDRYTPVCINGAVEAIGLALKHLQPAQAEVGRGVNGSVAFNRRFIMRDGTGQTHPPSCSPDILCSEGPADPEVGVMRFTGAHGKPIAYALHHTCHPTHGYPKRWISADWPGTWARGVVELGGGEGVALVLNGFCGNIHHGNHLDPQWKDDFHAMGRKLTETTATALARLTPIDEPVLGVTTRHLRIPMRSPSAEEVKAARALLKRHPQPTWTDAAKTAVSWDWVYAAMRVDLAYNVKRQPRFDYPVQVFRLGQVGIVAVPGEPFVEEQLRIKELSPAPYTFMAHMSNSYVGYIPTPAAFRRGGYETHTGAGSKLHPSALKRMGDTSLALLRELFKTRG
ncbi:MAG: hypothetical protein K8T26_17570 [Lentisphaerae bacterium]|nr:hypothetical protein [Lentisphaerota bacterium]